MKLLLKSIIFFGFILVLGSAGSADVGNVAFGTIIINSLLGLFLMLAGISAHMHYSRYLAKKARRARLLRQRRIYERQSVIAD